MLVLSRCLDEKIIIGGGARCGPEIVLTIVHIDPRGKVRIGIEAPPEIPIRRAEIPSPDRRRSAHGINPAK
jgi:carbon storage regulator CsrA